MESLGSEHKDTIPSQNANPYSPNIHDNIQICEPSHPRCAFALASFCRQVYIKFQKKRKKLEIIAFQVKPTNHPRRTANTHFPNPCQTNLEIPTTKKFPPSFCPQKKRTELYKHRVFPTRLYIKTIIMMMTNRRIFRSIMSSCCFLGLFCSMASITIPSAALAFQVSMSTKTPTATTTTTTTSTSTKIRIPQIIQGGMGIRISSWQLAREVSRLGQLGVISGTAMDTVLIRALQSGDTDGAMRRALASFPDPDMAQRILDKYYIQGGKDPHLPYKALPMWSTKPSQHLLEVTILANYAEVWLAKHQDDGTPTGGLVGMNLLTKVQLPTIPSLYGAMLAGVDYILMGAGIPMAVPGYLDNLAQGQDCRMAIDVEGKLPDDKEPPVLEFSPKEFWTQAGKLDLFETQLQTLPRPNFLPIVSSVVLAQSMLKRASGAGPTKGIQGFVIELPTAGGHNAPPRGFRYDAVTKAHSVDLNERGEPIYGPKDEVDLLKFGQATQGLPFWLAGSYACPEKFSEVLELGGTGVQVSRV
jgi:NAD(P)H-dependent flavin oxidoreductase YrpB (nitropropane dioxygenase family)